MAHNNLNGYYRKIHPHFWNFLEYKYYFNYYKDFKQKKIKIRGFIYKKRENLTNWCVFLNYHSSCIVLFTKL